MSNIHDEMALDKHGREICGSSVSIGVSTTTVDGDGLACVSFKATTPNRFWLSVCGSGRRCLRDSARTLQNSGKFQRQCGLARDGLFSFVLDCLSWARGEGREPFRKNQRTSASASRLGLFGSRNVAGSPRHGTAQGWSPPNPRCDRHPPSKSGLCRFAVPHPSGRLGRSATTPPPSSWMIAHI
jgi:hypothetical protein